MKKKMILIVALVALAWLPVSNLSAQSEEVVTEGRPPSEVSKSWGENDVDQAVEIPTPVKEVAPDDGGAEPPEVDILSYIVTGAGTFASEGSGASANIFMRLWERFWVRDIYALVIADIDKTGAYYQLLTPSATMPEIKVIKADYERDLPVNMRTVVPAVILDPVTGDPFMYIHLTIEKLP